MVLQEAKYWDRAFTKHAHISKKNPLTQQLPHSMCTARITFAHTLCLIKSFIGERAYAQKIKGKKVKLTVPKGTIKVKKHQIQKVSKSQTSIGPDPNLWLLLFSNFDFIWRFFRHCFDFYDCYLSCFWLFRVVIYVYLVFWTFCWRVFDSSFKFHLHFFWLGLLLLTFLIWFF